MPPRRQPKPENEPRRARRDAVTRPTSIAQGEFAKSATTRARILDASVTCLVENGYHRISTNAVAIKAGLARGAMLYHFPTRMDLIEATLYYVIEQRIEAYRDVMERQPRVKDGLDKAIDLYWEQIQEPYFTAFYELAFAARTDPELAAIVKPALEAYDRQRFEAARSIFPGLDTKLGDRFDLARDVTRFLMEGMALGFMTYDRDRRTNALLRLLKKTLRTLHTKE
jgi:AcrR family transcriptional regulator